MRQLTVRQKKVLDNYTKDNTNIITFYDDLPKEITTKLESINDTEILWCETERYLCDKVVQKRYA